MPLIQSGSEEAIRENIARLIREGKSPEEAAMGEEEASRILGGIHPEMRKPGTI